mgnify:CR=1 FL=1
MAQAIKDTLPYFLGIIGENTLALESENGKGESITFEHNGQ